MRYVTKCAAPGMYQCGKFRRCIDSIGLELLAQPSLHPQKDQLARAHAMERQIVTGWQPVTTFVAQIEGWYRIVVWSLAER